MSRPELAMALSTLGESPRPQEPRDQTPAVSAWSRSTAKRVFDVALVLAFTPLIAPLLLILAAIVKLTSPGPTLFRQVRIGARGRPFTILKLRTMYESAPGTPHGIASADSERITPAGRILRKFKLDELPQFFNVFRGEMSLVGPRPRIAGQQLGTFACRPGITGPATLAFAREELLLARLPQKSVARFYRETILPAKHRLDCGYMARATMLSDLRILFLTALGRWPSPHLALQPAPALRRILKEPKCTISTLHEVGATAPQD